MRRYCNKAKIFKGSFQDKKMEEEKSPKKFVKPGWIKMKPAEMEEIVIELAKNGESPAKIGLILRDKHGIPKTKLFGKRITEILKEKGVKYEVEKDVVDKKIGKLKGHISKNKHDYPAKRALTKRLWDLYKVNKRAQE